jgi:ribonucleoside-diphosphate reductase alpha chain
MTSTPHETANTAAASQENSMPIDQYFSTPGVDPFEQIEWVHRDASITDEDGKVIFDQKNVEVPKTFSQLATKVVVSKYFYGEQNTDERENSFRDLVHRVTRTIADWGVNDGVFASKEQGEVFYNELTWLCVNQYAAFNSPVWFNVGLYHQKGVEGSKHNHHWDEKESKVKPCPNTYEYPQGSACFIQSVDDTMEGIMDLAISEAMLFKHGSGTGTDLSTIRSSREKLSGGGRPSGPLSFMRVYDQIAAVVKSGGKTRRAAKMQSIKVNHPDIMDFINAKPNEERKAWSLIEQGYDGNFNGEAYGSIMFQNANLSVRVTDEFMRAAENDDSFQTYAVTDGKPLETLRAAEMLKAMAEGTHVCGDPGVQYDTTINDWHTCPNTGRINASNPCSEYMFLDNSACNLSSLNLMKFRNEDGSINIEAYKRAVRILIIAQELLVDNGSYPTPEIAQNSHDYRPLGLGYANLGCLLMSLGLPYDSDEGRSIAAALTAIMCGHAYTTSAELARVQGSFPGYEKNAEPMINVIKMHRDAVAGIDRGLCPDELASSSQDCWDNALALGSQYGYRNSQVTVIAPTGTIAFMMDCDTTGIEPDIALVKYKQLAGGGMLKIVNRTVNMALERLGYNKDQVKRIVDTIEEDDTIETSDVLDARHLPVFDCAFKAVKGQRSIHHLAHIKMMAAAQPFISGAISKTVNMPEESEVDEIQDAYLTGWKLGLKALAIYRDGSKRSQPLSTQQEKDKKENATDVAEIESLERRPQRVRLPQTRQSITHKFDVAGHEGYLTVGLYEDGQPGELFITMAKEGSTVGGLMDAFGISISLALQSGVPLGTIVEKFSHTRFEPAGMTTNRDIPFAKSLIDYIAKWLGITFLPGYRESNTPTRPGEAKPETSEKPKVDLGRISNRINELIDEVSNQPAEMVSGPDGTQKAASLDSQFQHFQSDAPVCDNCGSITVRNANCYRCFNCGSSQGCS